jgi:hypothetical protein
MNPYISEKTAPEQIGEPFFDLELSGRGKTETSGFFGKKLPENLVDLLHPTNF